MARQLLDEALALIRANYIFADRGERAAAVLGQRLAAGDYDGLDAQPLADRVTEDLFEVCADRHLRLILRAEELPEDTTPEQQDAAWDESQRLSNYRIARVQRLDGNVGYLDLRGVPGAQTGGRAIAAAMELVAHTEALIIDLRRNRGGDPDGVQLWNSYLFPDSDTHLNDIYHGGSKQTRQYWTLPHLPADRYLNRPVYVLTSAATFSAGEEFAYNLQAQGRATLIGETTRGGAHPTQRFRLSATLEIAVPIARSINPVTGTNWEGTGVVPDIAVPAAESFEVAYRTALRHVLATCTAAEVRAEATTALAERPDGDG